MRHFGHIGDRKNWRILVCQKSKFFILLYGPFEENPISKRTAIHQQQTIQRRSRTQIQCLVQWSSPWRLDNQSQHCRHSTVLQDIYAQTSSCIWFRYSAYCCSQTWLGTTRSTGCYYDWLWLRQCQAPMISKRIPNCLHLCTAPVVVDCVGMNVSYTNEY